MNALCKMALRQALAELENAQTLVYRDKTNPAECARTGTMTNKLLTHIQKAREWVHATMEKPQ